MRMLRLGLIGIPLLTGAAFAAEPLSESQMDATTAGAAFSAFSVADAYASGKVVATATGTVAQVGPVLGGIHYIFNVGEIAAGPLDALPGAGPTSALLTSRLPP